MQLPAPFSKLEPFVDQWALGTERERNHARLTSTMEEIQEFYDAMLSQINEALAYLDRFPLGDMPEDAQMLFNLTLSLAEVSNSVERFGEPAVPNGFDSARFTPFSPYGPIP